MGEKILMRKKIRSFVLLLPELREVVSLNAHKEQRHAIKKKKKNSNISQKSTRL